MAELTSDSAVTHSVGTHPLNTLPTVKEANGSLPNGYSTASLNTQQSFGGSRQMVGVRTALGLHAHAPVDKVHDEQEHHQLIWPRIRLALREPLAEFFGKWPYFHTRPCFRRLLLRPPCLRECQKAKQSPMRNCHVFFSSYILWYD